MNIELFQQANQKMIDNCKKVIVGKDEVISNVFNTFICAGNVLLEDLPGTGKTMLLRSFAKSIGADFKRVQFTPDLMPSDLTGINFYNQKTTEFEFHKGPLFTNIVLADEINRATPRTQSALLEAMEERQVSVDGNTYELANPFMVMATQNPLESYGTFPLPEAQLDRFFMCLQLGYMKPEQELEVIVRQASTEILNTLQPVVTMEEIAEMKRTYHEVTMSEAVQKYLMAIVEETRNSRKFAYGVSTRGAIALYQASQVHAAFAGRNYVIPEDIKALAPAVLSHRLTTGSSNRETRIVFEDLLAQIQVPLEKVE